MKRSIFYAIPLIFLLTMTACNENPVYSSPKYQGFAKIGILTVVEDCIIPEGCGPTYKLWNTDLKTFTPLLGDLEFEDNGFIVGVQGAQTILPESEYRDLNYRGPTVAIAVSSYTKLNTLKYHKFLLAKANDYTKKNYPCMIVEPLPGVWGTKWDKSFAWEVDDRAILKVRMTDHLSGRQSAPFYELWYDGDTGEFIQEISDFQEINPCQ